MKSFQPVSRFASLFAIIGVLALGAFSGGCAGTATRDSTGEYVDDTVITTKVKTAMVRDDNVKAGAVSVETVKGVVQLSGFVNTAEQKSAAGHVAWTVKGVKEVKNNLIVK